MDKKDGLGYGGHNLRSASKKFLKSVLVSVAVSLCPAHSDQHLIKTSKDKGHFCCKPQNLLKDVVLVYRFFVAR